MRGVVVAGPNGVQHLSGALATAWRLLEAPTSSAELAAAFATMGAVDELEESDILVRLVERDLIREVS
jgi:hypothetical protein